MTAAEKRAIIGKYQKFFKTKDGKEVLDHIKIMFGVEQPSTVPNDPVSTGFNDGLAQAYFRLKQIVEMDISKIKDNPEGK